jgi:hypothetical protein
MIRRILYLLWTERYPKAACEVSTGEFVPTVAAYLIIVTGRLAFAAAFVTYVLFA